MPNLDKTTLRPSSQEVEFLTRAYNFFLDINDEITDKTFWNKDSYYRFNRIKDAILVYSEILEYEPIEWFLNALKRLRPPMEAELSKDFLLFVRNLVIHFPFFKSWDAVQFTKNLINWSAPGKSIDKFLTRYSGSTEVKYRMWSTKNKEMTYVPIKFPEKYDQELVIDLKSITPEKEGVLFLMSLMHRVLISQVESIKEMPE